MTWFLERQGEQQPPPMTRPAPSAGEQFGAAFREIQIEDDAWRRAERFRRQIEDEIADAIGEDAARPGREDWIRATNPETRAEWLMERAAPIAAQDPARYGRLPLTQEQFEAELVRRRQAELEEAREVLDMGDAPVSQFMGQLAGFAWHPVNIALSVVGGAGAGGVRATGRFMGREAAWNAAAEAIILQDAQRVAEELDLDDPNAAERIIFGAAAGAAFAGAISGAVRGVDYMRLRRQAEGELRPEGTRGIDHEAAIDRAEADLRAGIEPAPDAPAAPERGGAAGDLTDEQILSRIIGVESGGNATAQNPRSSARGLGQFIESTWLDMIRRHRPDLAVGLSRAQILALRDDPQLNADMTLRYLQENRAHLADAGVSTDPGALYLAHFMGPGGAVQALRAPGSTPISRLMSPAAIRANAPIRHNGRSFAQFTASDLRSWAAAKMGRPVSGGQGFAPATGGAAPDPGGRTFIDGPGQRQRPGMTRIDEVVTPAGTRVPVRYSVVELDSLRAAEGRFQPRDRAMRAGSDEQISEIAARLDAARLMPSPEADRGAPIVGADRMIESGNGRVAAIARAAELHPERYDAYVQAIRDAGFDIPADMRRPVLVAERQGDMSDAQRRAFVAESNDTAVMRMAASEQAGRDADFLSQAAFDAYRPGQPLTAPDQGEFLRRVMAQMPQAERAAMLTPEGRLNVDGLRRLRQAMFARAYDAPDLLRLLAESPSPQLRAMLDMLEDLAPDWAAFRASVDAGLIRADFDITAPMIDMVRTIARARTEGREGQSVIAAIRDRMAQADMFAAPDEALMERLLSAFYAGARARRPEATGDILRRYLADAHVAGRADADDLFAAPPPPRDVLARAIKQHEDRTPYEMPAAPDAEAAAAATVLPDARLIAPETLADGAGSPALVRAADDIEAGLRARVLPEDAPAPQRAAEAPPGDPAPTPARQGETAPAAPLADEFAGLRDLTIRLDETGPELRVADILDDLARDADLERAVRTCGLGGRGGA